MNLFAEQKQTHKLWGKKKLMVITKEDKLGGEGWTRGLGLAGAPEAYGVTGQRGPAV